MKLAYKGIDSAGVSVSDVIEAASISQAVESLHEQGLFVTDITESDGRAKKVVSRRAPAKPKSARLKIGELLFFTRQMAMLLRAGSPVVPALVAIGKQMKGPAGTVINGIRGDMEGGRGLADSMREFSSSFPATYVAVIGAGEMSANLPDMFTRLASLVSGKREIRNRVLAATAYPALLICLSASIVTTMVVFVVPRFKSLFASLNSPLPTSTRIMFATSQALREHWPWAVGAAVVIVCSMLVVCKSRAGRRWLCDVQTRLPLVGKLLTRLMVAQMYRVLGLLLESRVGLMESLTLSGRISDNRDYQALQATMIAAVESGSRLGEAMQQSKLISPSIAQAVGIGEESGNLDQAMLFVADVMDEENAQLISAITKLIEPLILIVMGFVVGGIALSLFVPLFDLAAMAD